MSDGIISASHVVKTPKKVPQNGQNEIESVYKQQHSIAIQQNTPSQSQASTRLLEQTDN